MEKAEQLRREIEEMNQLVARIRLSMSELEQAYQKSTHDLSKFEAMRKTQTYTFTTISNRGLAPE
jgi:hypothetical protein